MRGASDQLAVGPPDVERISGVERQLLGACLWSGVTGTGGFDDAAEIVSPEDFATYAHRVVFQVMLGLREANAPANAVTVYERLRATGQAAELGDNPGVWLGETVSPETGEASDLNAAHYARLVRSASEHRQLKRAVLEMSAVVTDPARPVEDARAACEQILFDEGDSEGGVRVENLTAAATGVQDVFDRIDDIKCGRASAGLPTGFRELDTLLCGMEAGELVVIAARPSVGKTALATAITTNATAAGVPALLFSIEMPRLSIFQRVLAMRSGVPLTSIQKGWVSGEQFDKVFEAGNALAKEPLFVQDATPMSAARIVSCVRRGVRRHKLGLVVVDYLGMIEMENQRDNRVQQVGLASKRMKDLAKNCKIPLVLLCQLNRACEDRPDGKPKLSDLRDSGEVEQNADVVILLNRQKGQRDDADVVLVDAQVAKARNGLVGEVTLAYRKRITRYENAPAVF